MRRSASSARGMRATTPLACSNGIDEARFVEIAIRRSPRRHGQLLGQVERRPCDLGWRSRASGAASAAADSSSVTWPSAIARCTISVRMTPGEDRVHADTAAGPFDRQFAGEADDGGLGGGVGAAMRHPEQGGHRGDHDDRCRDRGRASLWPIRAEARRRRDVASGASGRTRCRSPRPRAFSTGSRRCSRGCRGPARRSASAAAIARSTSAEPGHVTGEPPASVTSSTATRSPRGRERLGDRRADSLQSSSDGDYGHTPRLVVGASRPGHES